MWRMVDRSTTARWDPGRLAVAVVATVFSLAGLLELASGTGGALPANDAVHLLLGVIGLAVARGEHGARTYLIAGGVVYFLWHYGGPIVLSDSLGASLGTVPIKLTTVNDWLNLWLAVSMIVLACLTGDRRPARQYAAREPAEPVEPVDLSTLTVSWRQVRPSAAIPSARPRRVRASAGSRPSAPGRTGYGYVI
jgi:hypothetical protein